MHPGDRQEVRQASTDEALPQCGIQAFAAPEQEGIGESGLPWEQLVEVPLRAAPQGEEGVLPESWLCDSRK